MRVVAWVVVLHGLLALSSYGFSVACFAWQESNPAAFRSNTILGWPLAIELPNVAVTIALSAAAAAVLRGRPAGRRAAVRLLVAQAVLDPAATAVVAVYRNAHYSYIPQSPAFVAYYDGLYVAAATYAVLISGGLALLLNRPEARAAFADADDGG